MRASLIDKWNKETDIKKIFNSYFSFISQERKQFSGTNKKISAVKIKSGEELEDNGTMLTSLLNLSTHGMLDAEKEFKSFQAKSQLTKTHTQSMWLLVTASITAHTSPV